MGQLLCNKLPEGTPSGSHKNLPVTEAGVRHDAGGPPNAKRTLLPLVPSPGRRDARQWFPGLVIELEFMAAICSDNISQIISIYPHNFRLQVYI